MSTLKLREVGRSKTVCFDLENRPLAYWYDGETTSEITAFGWKWRGEPVRTLLLQPDGSFLRDDGQEIDDGLAYLVFRDVLCRAGLVYGHNIRKHDLPMFQAGLLRRELPPLPPLLTSDTLRDYPRRNGMSASLENLAIMYGIGGKKMPMSQPEWEQANRLRPDGIELARRRVASDVLLQERLRDKLLDLSLLGVPKVWRP